jgi:hypothetical protein
VAVTAEKLRFPHEPVPRGRCRMACTSPEKTHT